MLSSESGSDLIRLFPCSSLRGLFKDTSCSGDLWTWDLDREELSGPHTPNIQQQDGKNAIDTLVQKEKMESTEKSAYQFWNPPRKMLAVFKIRTQSYYCLGSWLHPLGSGLFLLSHPFFCKRLPCLQSQNFLSLFPASGTLGVTLPLFILYCLYPFQSKLVLSCQYTFFFLKFVVLLQILLEIYSIRQKP